MGQVEPPMPERFHAFLRTPLYLMVLWAKRHHALMGTADTSTVDGCGYMMDRAGPTANKAWQLGHALKVLALLRCGSVLTVPTPLHGRLTL